MPDETWDSVSDAALRTWILGLLLVVCAGGVIAARLMFGQTPMALAWLVAAFLSFGVYRSASGDKARLWAYWCSLLLAATCAILLSLRFFT